MPIYEYVCHSCGNEFEQLQGWSDGAPSCSACHSDNVTRRLSPPAIHFKGSGWYITDSKNGKNGNGVAGSNGSGKDGKEEKASAKASDSEASSSAGKETAGGTEAKSDTPAKKETGKIKAAE